MFRTLYLSAFCLGAILAFYLSWQIDIRVLLLLILLLSGCLKLCRPIFAHQRAFLYFILFTFIGLTYSTYRTQNALNQQWSVEMYPKSVPLTITVIGLPEYNEEGQTRFLAQARNAKGQTFRLMLSDFAARQWQIGSTWQITARVRTPVGTRNKVGFDKEAWALAQNIDGFASIGTQRTRLPETTFHPYAWLNKWREKASLRWQQNLAHSPQGQALMRALIIGDQAGLDHAAWQAFRPLGINHLISISGLHISMFALLMGAMVNKLMHYLPRTPARPRAYSSLFGWLAAALYTLFTGAEIPALRSLLMLSVFAWVWWRRGYIGSWRTWWLAMTLVLLWQPMGVLSVGFWLSFGLLGAMMWVLSHRLPAFSSWSNTLMLAIKGQWAATLCGGVATIFLFGSLPVFSPLVNAVAIPWFSWLLVPFGVLVSLLPFDLPMTLVAQLAEFTMNILLKLGNWLPEWHFAHANAPLFWLAIIGSLILLLPANTRFKPLASIALCAFLVYQPPKLSGSLNITVFDVGQGLSVLLQTAQHNILFDSGRADAAVNLLPNLRAMGIRKLDTLILSHHDNDHDGGFPTLQKHLPIKQLFAGQPEYYSGSQNCHQTRSWQIDNVHFEFLNIQHNHLQEDNEQSCVLRIITHQTALLITGDLGKKGEAALINEYGESIASQILILGHHGSKHSNSSYFINAISPQYAIASSGFANSFKHPHPDVQNILSAHNVQLLRTDTQGKIALNITDNRIHFLPLLNKYWWQKKPFAPKKTPEKPTV